MPYFLPPKIENNEVGFNFCACLYGDLKKQGGNEIVVDFSTCSLFEGNLAAIMGAIFDVLAAEGHQIFLKPPLNKTVKKSLGRNHFFDAWNLETGVQDKENYVNYHSFEIDAIQTFKDYINQELLNKQKFPAHTDKAGRFIVDNIYEIYANATMHGDARKVTCCGEYDNTAHVLHMTIVDCGRTIEENVNEHFKKLGKNSISADEAIRWAFVEGNTTKNNTGGLGLAQLKEFIRMNKGSLDIISGRGWVVLNGEEEETHLLETAFPGTIVNLNFNFDDEDYYYMTSEKQSIDINDIL